MQISHENKFQNKKKNWFAKSCDILDVFEKLAQSMSFFSLSGSRGNQIDKTCNINFTKVNDPYENFRYL